MGYDPDFGTARKGPPSGPVDFLSLREIKESLGQDYLCVLCSHCKCHLNPLQTVYLCPHSFVASPLRLISSTCILLRKSGLSLVLGVLSFLFDYLRNNERYVCTQLRTSRANTPLTLQDVPFSATTKYFRMTPSTSGTPFYYSYLL
ncbi:Uncharacterized protein APZ42_026080 [Daphnia magna]|uniref:Uncharacterized protein n=1 Tax=Daphnia magna TaxID=35525 RepID=A0A164SIJ3_9CRUS|nr:Uncharacterized protein APZ42_026080 [Daphnia magna]